MRSPKICEKVLLHRTRSKLKFEPKKSITREKKRGQPSGTDPDGCEKIVEIAQKMSKFVKNGGTHRSKKTGNAPVKRAEALRHAFFRSKTQKDSSLMHQKNFRVRVLLKDIQAEAGAYRIPNEIKLEIR